MNKSKRIAISLVAGVLAALLCMVYGSSIRSQAEQVQAETLAKYGGDRVEVCVAARDIDVGETLDETNVITQEWLTSLLPRDAATELRQVRGDVTTSRIPKNAVICNVYTKAESHKLEVPEGKVAVSVAVDAEHSVGGATGVGSYVDVYVQKDGVTDRLCGAYVIDTSEDSGATREGKIEWVTLAADPEDVKELLGASGKGTVSLTIPATARGKKSGGDTKLSELGDSLSGGERQRIGIARAFLHDCPVIFLDEPTSNIDSLNESIILKSLYTEKQGKQILLVSHRKSTMAIADTVIEMN